MVTKTLNVEFKEVAPFSAKVCQYLPSSSRWFQTAAAVSPFAICAVWRAGSQRSDHVTRRARISQQVMTERIAKIEITTKSLHASKISSKQNFLTSSQLRACRSTCNFRFTFRQVWDELMRFCGEIYLKEIKEYLYIHMYMYFMVSVQNGVWFGMDLEDISFRKTLL